VAGRIVDETAATVSVFDRGFLYGDGVYEVARTAGGRPVDLPRHLDRLEASADHLAIVAPPRSLIADAIAQTLAAADNHDSYVRVIVTRGAGEIGLDPALADAPLLVVIVRPLTLPAPRLYELGVDVALVETRRTPRRSLDPAIKSGNYLNNILGLREAKAAGAYECVMLNHEGRIAEGSTSNLFVVRGGQLRTPALDDGLLAGITRRRVLELAAPIVTTAEAHLHAADVTDADEAFLTSSLRGVLPVTRVDRRALGDGHPGPITRRLMTAYAAYLARVAEGTET
jgi:branched-chain amino acid aminotransferase